MNYYKKERFKVEDIKKTREGKEILNTYIQIKLQGNFNLKEKSNLEEDSNLKEIILSESMKSSELNKKMLKRPKTQ